MATLHPSHGARVLLEREAGDTVRYRVSIYEPSALHVTLAHIDAGAVRIDPFTSAPPAWAVTYAERMLLGLAKKHASDGAWPRRLLRWRDARE